ncbi:uncharacterized protein A1O9_10203 [Exophiala aquamarina CBS 119918]|uniref:Uncharacterized protein n=1 Tax=Exophiala aquamarina CBS 119918 TaxID=1182545 RepID=A0A072P2A4_9EURO|nr:uncharacterized protein A1O9_10203 [Exophiala aquamarina CBS 119918]KEF53802.1 hypothetical protein A1O9_10203 [Exophiala aquamarina CBS 119918]
MKVSSLITLIAALGATALLSCCTFAGYNTGTLSNVSMFTVNASQIANTNFDNSTGNGCNCVEFVNGTLTINGTSVENGTIETETASLGTAEYYAVFTLNYCEGQYLPNYRDSDASAVLTRCEKPSLAKRFDLANIIEKAIEQLGDLLNLSLDMDDLDWPNGITNAFLYVKSAGSAMVAFFVIGLLFLLISVLAGALGLFLENRFVTILLVISTVLATLSLGIGAGIATAVITTVVNGINSSGDDIGISAEQGNYFVAMIWIAVALLFLSALTATVQLCTGGSRSAGGGRRAQKMRMKQQEGYGMPMMPPRYYRGSMPYYMPMGMNDDPYMDPYSSRRNLMRDDEYDEFR